MQKLSDEQLLSLRDTWAIFEVLKEDAISGIWDDEKHAEMWRTAKRAFDDCTAALAAGDEDQLKVSHQLLGGILQNGLKAVASEEKLARITELQVKVQASEMKRVQALDNFVDPKAFYDFIEIVYYGIQTFVRSSEDARNFEALIDGAFSRKPEVKGLEARTAP